MAKSNNLRPPFGEGGTPDEARELGKMGGIKSGEVRRRKSAMKDIAQMVLGLKPNITQGAKLQLKQMGIDERDLTTQTVALVKILEKAMKGDVQAMQFIRDTAGQKPTDKLDVVQTTNVKTKVKINVIGLDVDDDEPEQE